MKAILRSLNKKLYFFNRNSEIRIMGYDEARDFLLNYTSEKYCGKDDVSEFSKMPSDANAIIVAVVEDNNQLVVHSPEVFKEILVDGQAKLLTSAGFAEKHGKTDSMVRRLCREGRIPEHVKIGNAYFIPESLPYPGSKN